MVLSDAPLPADQLLRECAQKQAAVAWPLPVDIHLDRLLDQADAAGENTSRKELAAAIIASAKFSDAQLGNCSAGTELPESETCFRFQRGTTL